MDILIFDHCLNHKGSLCKNVDTHYIELQERNGVLDVRLLLDRKMDDCVILFLNRLITLAGLLLQRSLGVASLYGRPYIIMISPKDYRGYPTSRAPRPNRLDYLSYPYDRSTLGSMPYLILV